MKNVAILGSTGSIGRQTLEVIAHYPDRFRVVALAAGRQVDQLVAQARQFQPRLVSVATRELAEEVRLRLPSHIRVCYGEEGLLEVATHPECHFLLSGILGSIGLKPTLAAIQAGIPIGLANKETLVSAGHLVMREAKKRGVPILPVDSEHSAIFQALQGQSREGVRQLILTASGGSLRHLTRQELRTVTIREVLQHPNWSMGAKITVDSATMMNKGLEVIEAHWLFGVPFDKIKVLIHPESVIHSMVEFVDGAILAQLGLPDMRTPIQYALSYPERLPHIQAEYLSLDHLRALHLEKVDEARYPALSIAYRAGRAGGLYPTVMNAANEEAVHAFLEGRLPFDRIEQVVEHVLNRCQGGKDPSLEEVLEADSWARRAAREQITALTH
ncbi:MAG: 1-deoxy-D-xylulose-5-phosphate reductoisomerase [Bacillus thermozeamaize]|uniref:1-deoxy-D-xylulose 5-phosphate reductoisomerase n=1 Tax=Bacillus thermozeamaize TaxID=230954 RepID=A0A1Y3PLZ1_9BACI|nr:MAG: 1-deoxy-D-xylulose-5-phosphate reductoisomerase [Bacillus thermozeamaize]